MVGPWEKSRADQEAIKEASRDCPLHSAATSRHLLPTATLAKAVPTKRAESVMLDASAPPAHDATSLAFSLLVLRASPRRDQPA